jgi:hypothetical protein
VIVDSFKFPSSATAAEIGVAHLHINDEDLPADPEIALPMHLLGAGAARSGECFGALRLQNLPDTGPI